MVLEAGKPKVKAAIDSVSGKSLLPGAETALFSLCPHMVEGIRLLSGVFYKGTNLIHEASTSVT